MQSKVIPTPSLQDAMRTENALQETSLIDTVLKNGKYVLDALLGQGTFGITYRATDTESGSTVVLKTLADSLQNHPEFHQFQRQFLADAQRLANCQHPHLVQVLDSFEEAGCPYLVMEYIPGQTLAELVASSSPLPKSQVVEYIRQVGAALTTLHKAGLLHRDVKPENIIQRQDTEAVVLTDVGITCAWTPGIRQTHANFLSAGYASLEQSLPDGKSTTATDVYALAATCYFLLTGQAPIAAPLREHIPLTDLQQYHPDISPAVEAALWWGLEILSKDRPQSVEDWLLHFPLNEQPEVTEDISITQGDLPQVAAEEKEDLQASFAVLPSQSLTLPTIGQPEAEEMELQASLAIVRPNRVSLPSFPEYPKVPENLESSKSDRPLTTTTVSPTIAPAPTPLQRRSRFPKPKFPLKALMMTGAIAASAGIGFGFALRINSPDEPGSTLLHTEQSFPPRRDWPVSEPLTIP
ncbi:MAG: serine/threonine protein kinase [Kastovskya adunca ATA6-11-RM4]|jgi:serine/threonine-protein kinase|nr:serine/threonine protein kinase [Kastovskya adunca ATA6-11-RM4]